MKRIAIILLIFWQFAANAETRPATQPASQPINRGPPTVVLNDLVALYDPVPFDHASHSKMAEMWNGCQTCHHRTPNPATRPSDIPTTRTQADSAAIPRCKSCHPATPDNPQIKMPSLKGAYHRQCLNCHREWTGENACVKCHAPRDAKIVKAAPEVDDIAGRMHPPIPEPKDQVLRARFTPVAGRNVLFRHNEHAHQFGIRCATCHRRDSCTDCHADGAANAVESARPRPMQIAATWRDSHAPCISCHEHDSCNHCHYPDDYPEPEAFSHSTSGQTLDKDHNQLKCVQCHAQLKASPSCGDASCHAKRAVNFPIDRPGPFRKPRPTTAPTTSPTIAITTEVSTTQPATRPTIIRIRRGGL
jgi:hypothetical protein